MKNVSKVAFDLKSAFLDLQQEITQHLSTSRKHIKHPGAKGNASELKWMSTFEEYLPKRYCLSKAFIIDSKGQQSEEIDIVIYDRQYSPFLFKRENSLFIPAESVYAVLEIRQSTNKNNLLYAGKKAASVRRLFRTSAPVPYVEGTYGSKPLFKIIAGIITLDSDWKEPFGKAFKSTIDRLVKDEQIDLGCILRYGAFEAKYKSPQSAQFIISPKKNVLIFFFLKLLYRLQQLGTCPAIDIEKYGKSVLTS
jgi:hypothetical protein